MHVDTIAHFVRFEVVEVVMKSSILGCDAK
jgi:hypothetical protein